jgi:membrane-associated phospholipid phosphatase
MAERTARGIAVLLCLLALPSPAVGQDATVPSRNFLQTIADGVKSVVSKESVPVLSSAAALSLFALPFDEALTYSASCSTFQKTAFDGWARIGGQEWLLASGALATYVVGRTTGQLKVAAVGGDLIESQVVAGITTLALKYAIPRTRPDGEPRSFPSGHAAGTFAAATVIQRHFGVKGAVPAYTLATLISTARLQANSHYPTDVIIGAALGILSGRAATFALAGHHVSLSPAATQGGVLVHASIH